MRYRIIVGALLVVGCLGVGAVATTGGDVGPVRQWGLVNFVDPIWVGDIVMMGPHLIVHDSEKMAKGQPCTTIYRFDPKRGPQEAVVSFHCKPRRAQVVDRVTVVTERVTATGGAKLREFQLAGDAEAHAVPGK
jgi:hypothetical protein